MQEMWQSIPAWKGFYEVSNQGRVRSVSRAVKGRWGLTHYKGRILRAYGKKYLLVCLVETGFGRKEYRYIHDLVLLSFVGPKPRGKEVCHGKAGPHINALSNLRYDTRSNNAIEAWGNRK